MQYMKAIPLARTKEVRDDGTIVEVVIWQLPEPLPPSTHSFKYRLFYGTSMEERVRYDNERGKPEFDTLELFSAISRSDVVSDQ